MNIALAAYCFVNNDMAFNKSQIEKAMKKVKGKADLLCFGETFLQGFDALTWEYPHDRAVAVTQDSPVIKALCDLTLRYGVDLLFGYVERDGEALYSSCVLLSAGRIHHNYRRISRGWKEYRRTDGHYCEGEDTADFTYRGKTFRIALCGDLWDFPERFRTEGVLLWPVYVNFTHSDWEKYEQEYAQQADLAAKATLLINSLTVDPPAIGGAFCFQNGVIVSRLPYGAEDILYVEI